MNKLEAIMRQVRLYEEDYLDWEENQSEVAPSRLEVAIGLIASALLTGLLLLSL